MKYYAVKLIHSRENNGLYDETEESEWVLFTDWSDEIHIHIKDLDGKYVAYENCRNRAFDLDGWMNIHYPHIQVERGTFSIDFDNLTIQRIEG